MKKLFTILIILSVVMFASCAAQQTYTDEAINKAFATASPRSDAETQAECQTVVEGFTDKPVEFVKKIGSDEKNEHQRQNYLGYYVFEDDLYTYIVDPDYLYIRRIMVADKAWDKLSNSPQLKISGEEAKEKATDIFKKILSQFFIQGSEASATYSANHNDGLRPDAVNYTVTILEEINGIPTGNGAGLTITDDGALQGGNFEIGDPDHIKKLLKDKDKMISSDAAAQIAVDKIKAMKELDAENILIDDTKTIELITWKDMTVWRVYITYDKRGESTMVCRGAIVPVDVFSGEVVAGAVGLH
jgi:hypothetical protein